MKAKKIFVHLVSSKKFFIATGILIFLITIEFTTDLAEIVIGSVLKATNPYRPRSGTIWELYQKDRIAMTQLEEITRALPEKKEEIPDINDLMQLKAELEQDSTVLITAEQFRELYNQIPTPLSYEIISPFDLLKLAHSQKWIWTKVVRGESCLNFYFLDGDKQLLMDTYPSLSVLYNLRDTEKGTRATLDSITIFKGQIITREQFFAVFDDLPNSVKLRLINNPFELVKWDKNIQKVGVSRYVVDNTVTIGFQVNQDMFTEVYTFEASDWAVEYFINQLKELYPELALDVLEGRKSEFPDD